LNKQHYFDMNRAYTWATIKQYNFVKQCIYDEWKPKDIAKALGMQPQKVRGIYRRMGVRIVKGNGRFKKGNVPFNKGMKGFRVSPGTEFKKGNTPPNTKPVGSIRINKDGLQEIKYCLHKWRSLHSHLWILKNGEIKKGSVVIFKEGADKMNFTINNLRLVTRGELLKMNKKNAPNKLR
jgi:hypothetical protein